MWLGVEDTASVNFREPTPACRKAWRQSTFTLACLNLREEARKLGSRSVVRPAGQSEERASAARQLQGVSLVETFFVTDQLEYSDRQYSGKLRRL